jgi:hypothetical protein
MISFIGISSIAELVPDTGLFSQFEVVLVVPIADDAVIEVIINMILGQKLSK